MSYQVFYWIHVFSYVAWLLAFAGSLLFLYRVRTSDTPGDVRKAMRSERLITNIGGHLGALGILISGGALASIPDGIQWGWFPFDEHGWLAVKQLLFFMILVLIVLSVRRGKAFKKDLNAAPEGEMTQETVEKWGAAYRISFIVYMLVLINTVIGLYRPF